MAKRKRANCTITQLRKLVLDVQEEYSMSRAEACALIGEEIAISNETLYGRVSGKIGHTLNWAAYRLAGIVLLDEDYGRAE